MIKNFILILIPLYMGCTTTIDLEKLSLEEEFSELEKEINIDNSNLLDKEKQIYNHFVNENATNVKYRNLILEDGAEFGVINNIIKGIKGSTNKTEISQKLINYLEEKYGEGTLIFDNGESKAYLWEENCTIIHFGIPILYVTEDNVRKKELGG